MNLDLSQAFSRAQTVVNGLVAAIPSIVVALIVFGVLTAVKRQLTAHGIDLPFPTQQILFHDQTEECDGDRVRQREGWPAGPSNAPASRKVADAIARISGPAASRMDGE